MRARRIGPLVPFACSYRRDGHLYGITLYASGWGMMEALGRRLGVSVDGKMVATFRA